MVAAITCTQLGRAEAAAAGVGKRRVARGDDLDASAAASRVDDAVTVTADVISARQEAAQDRFERPLHARHERVAVQVEDDGALAPAAPQHVRHGARVGPHGVQRGRREPLGEDAVRVAVRDGPVGVGLDGRAAPVGQQLGRHHGDHADGGARADARRPFEWL